MKKADREKFEEWYESIGNETFDFRNEMSEGEQGIVVNGNRATLKVDGYCEKTKTVYQFHGCYWHGVQNVLRRTDGKQT